MFLDYTSFVAITCECMTFVSKQLQLFSNDEISRLYVELARESNTTHFLPSGMYSAVVGELDFEMDASLDFAKIKAAPLKAVVH